MRKVSNSSGNFEINKGDLVTILQDIACYEVINSCRSNTRLFKLINVENGRKRTVEDFQLTGKQR